MKKLILTLSLLILAISLCACGANQPAPAETSTPASAPAQTPIPAETEAPTPAEPESSDPINVMVLNGTTGFGMAKLIHDSAPEEYNFSVETDASAVTAALINGSCDIAALPTNAAAALYNKTDGAVQCLALNTRGVLYLITGEGETVESLSDLDGRTVYAPAQNPSFILSALCEKAGLDVTVDNSYAQPADLRTALAVGEITLAVLPEPMVTAACAANEALTVALDLTAEWDNLFSSGSLVQGCVAVRKAFAEANPNAVDAFLTAYEASIVYLSEDAESAAQYIVEAGIFSAAPLAQKALPRCNVCFVAGEEMKTALSGFLDVIFETAPASIGGAIPGDDFYYLQK